MSLPDRPFSLAVASSRSPRRMTEDSSAEEEARRAARGREGSLVQTGPTAVVVPPGTRPGQDRPEMDTSATPYRSERAGSGTFGSAVARLARGRPARPAPPGPDREVQFVPFRGETVPDAPGAPISERDDGEEPGTLERAARATGRGVMGAVDKALGVARGAVDRLPVGGAVALGHPPGVAEALKEVTKANMMRGGDERDAAMEAALLRLAEESHAAGIEIPADAAAVAGLFGDIGREAVYAIPSTVVAGPFGAVVAKGIPLGRVAARMAPRAAARTAGFVRGAAFETAAAPVFTGARAGLEQGEINREVLAEGQAALTGTIDVGGVPVPVALLGAIGGVAGARAGTRALDRQKGQAQDIFNALVTENRAEAAGARVVSDAGGRRVVFPSGEEVPFNALADLYRESPGLKEAMRKYGSPGGFPARGIERRAHPFRTTGERPQPLTGVLRREEIIEPPKVRTINIDGVDYQVTAVPNVGGVMTRAGQVVARLPKPDSEVVIAREIPKDTPLPTQVEAALRNVIEETASEATALQSVSRNAENPSIVRAVESYKRTRGIRNEPVRGFQGRTYNPAVHRQIAEAYEALPRVDTSPQTVRSYQAFRNEVADQYKYMTDELGVKVEFTTADPYPNSTAMMDDVRQGRLRVYSGGGRPNPLLGEVDPATGQSYNNMFRAVHDFFGHSAHGNQFGKYGEEMAWHAHSRMFSPEAQPAMTTETRGHNAFFNQAARNRDLPVSERQFAEQKQGLLPQEFWPDEAQDAVQGGIRGFLSDESGIGRLSDPGVPSGRRPTRGAVAATTAAVSQQQQPPASTVAQGVTTAAQHIANPKPAVSGGRMQQAAASLGNRVAAAGTDGLNTITRTFRLNLTKVESWARKDLGVPGVRYADDLLDVVDRGLTRAGRNFEDVRSVSRRFKLTKEEREAISSAVHNQTIAQLDPRLRSAARRLNAIFDRGLRTLQQAGFKRDGNPIAGSGRFIPQILNKTGADIVKRAAQSPTHGTVQGAAARMVSEGRASTIDDAVKILQSLYHKNVQGDLGYYTRVRQQVPDDWMELDFLKWSEDFFKTDGHYVEGWLKWGDQHIGAKTIFNEIRESGMVGEAHLLELHHRVHFGQTAPISASERSVVAAFSNFLTATKLSSPLTTIRQIGQRYINTSDLPLTAVIGASRDIPPIVGRWNKAANKQAGKVRRSGAVQAKATATQDIITGGRSEFDVAPGEGIPSRILQATGFAAGEEGNQLFVPIAAKRALETTLTKYLEAEARQGRTPYLKQVLDHVRELNLGSIQGARLRLLERLTNDDQHLARVMNAWKSGRRISPTDMQAVMIRANRDRNFALDALTKPVKWETHPVFRLALKFKPFMAKQFAYMNRHIYREAVKGNMAPYVRSVAAGTVVAEVWNLMRDVFLGRQDAIITQLLKDPESLDEWHEWALEVLVEHQLDAATIGLFSDLVWGWDNFIFGPAKGTANNVAFAARDAILRAGRTGEMRQTLLALDNFAKKEIPAVKLGLAAAIKADSWFQPDENKYPDWRRIRTNAIEAKIRYDSSTMTARAVEQLRDVAEGREGFDPTEKTLFYRYAWENMMLGDYDDASKYLVEIMRDTQGKTNKQLKAGIEQSMRGQAPLGALSRSKTWEDNANVKRYLAELSPEARRETVALQREYLKRAQRVWDLTLKQLEEEK